MFLYKTKQNETEYLNSVKRDIICECVSISSYDILQKNFLGLLNQDESDILTCFCIKPNRTFIKWVFKVSVIVWHVLHLHRVDF